AEADVAAAQELDQAHARRAARRGEDVGAFLVGAEAGGLGRRRLDAEDLLAGEEGVAALLGRRLADEDVDDGGRGLVAELELDVLEAAVCWAWRQERVCLEEERPLGAPGDVVAPGEREGDAVEPGALDEHELGARLLQRGEVLRAPLAGRLGGRGVEGRAAAAAEAEAGLHRAAALLARARRPG